MANRWNANVRAKRVQRDEIWSLVYAKQMTVEKVPPGRGIPRRSRPCARMRIRPEVGSSAGVGPGAPGAAAAGGGAAGSGGAVPA